MRNLRNLRHSVLEHSSPSTPSACAWDASSKDLICVHGPSEEDSLIELRKWIQKETSGDSATDASEHVASWDALCPNPELSCDRVLNVRFFTDSSETTIVLAGGDIVNVSAATSERLQQIEIVGSVDDGIAAAAWSPDEELLAILTKADTFLYMTREFENVASVDLSSEDLKASKHVSVGWGRAETQFRGKGAKALRDPTVPEKVDEGLFSKKDGGEATISWRGDGAYVAVNSTMSSSRRVIRIYSREGELDGVSEPVDYMEGALSWRPAGNLMASIQRLEDRIDVIFFERNGLRHGHFSLRLSKAERETWGQKIELQWNVDSSVLAVCFLDRVQLWTMGNYHYYLKQEIRYRRVGKEEHLPFFAWHPEQPLLFAVGLEGCIHEFQYGYRVARSSIVSPHDYGIVSVIDGTTLKVTPMRISNVPPPMALVEAFVQSNIIDVCYLNVGNHGGEVVLIAVLHHDGIALFEWNPKEKVSEFLLRAKSYGYPLLDRLLDIQEGFSFRQIAFVDHETVLVLASGAKGSQLIRISVKEEGKSEERIDNVSQVTELVSVSTNTLWPPYLWIGSQLLSYTPDMVDALKEKSTGYLSVLNGHIIDCAGSAESIALADLKDLPHSSKAYSSHVVFSVERNGMLYANRRCITRGCTSFLVTPSHLIFTTSQHLLKFVHLADEETLEVPADAPEEDERCRSIERGSRLVTVIPSTSALILQMPRGNLETIYPRALVLPLIRANINDNKYKKAFLACRNHRVDMNILYDHAPEKFLRSVDLFLDQVQRVEHIDLFLSQLREADVSKTMYKDTMPNKNLQEDRCVSSDILSDTTTKDESKVNGICDAFLESLASRKSTNLQNTITAHVCKNPPDLEAGLLEVASISRENVENGDKAVEHICFLADVNRLYDNALGLYDLDLTLQIAQQSQRDPREYIPFLQKLKDQPLLRMKVDIDNYLGRFSKVLTHFQDLNDFEAFQTHMAKYSLYEEALVRYRYQEDLINAIMKLYAGYLKTSSKHKEAAVAYEYLQDYEAALESYRLAHLWQEALTCASLVPFDNTQMRAFALSIAEAQKELKEYRSAAIIHLDYSKDVEEATRLFCKGYHFAEATRLVSLHQKPDLLQTIVDTGLAEGQATMTELLAECKGQLNAQVPRIRELRVKKAEEPLAFYDADVNGGADIPDNISLAGTDASTAGGTLFTRYTNRTSTVATNATRKTSKKRRQEERKRARGKKGSVYEEEYLVNSIARLIERVNSIGDEVERLVTGLMRRGMRERARAVEAAMVSVVDICKECAPEFFQIPEKKHKEEKGEVSEFHATGGDAVLLESLEEARTPKEPPVVKDFQRLSILGR